MCNQQNLKITTNNKAYDAWDRKQEELEGLKLGMNQGSGIMKFHSYQPGFHMRFRRKRARGRSKIEVVWFRDFEEEGDLGKKISNTRKNTIWHYSQSLHFLTVSVFDMSSVISIRIQTIQLKVLFTSGRIFKLINS